MIWIWTLFGTLVGVAGLRHWRRLRSLRTGAPPRVDDAALRQILQTGTLAGADEPLDMKKIARAEEDFWNEPWDEPEEYPR